MRFAQWLNEGLAFQNRIHLFRGIGRPNNMDRLGRWWSTNPYYAVKYGGSQLGQVFVATLNKGDLQRGLSDGSVADVTQDEYPNYVFRTVDPPGARPMTMVELQGLQKLAGGNSPPTTSPGRPAMPGGQTLKQLWGQAAIKAAYDVFGN